MIHSISFKYALDLAEVSSEASGGPTSTTSLLMPPFFKIFVAFLSFAGIIIS